MATLRSKLVLSLTALTWWMATPAAYLEIGFNTTQTFGPDGPWYGIEVDAAYLFSGSDHFSLSLLPALWGSTEGSGPTAWIPIQRSCEAYPTQAGCGEGGLVPKPASSSVRFNQTWWNSFTNQDAGYKWNCSGPLTGMSLEAGGSFSMEGAFVGVANKSYVTYPSRITAGLELGFLSLGAGTQDLLTIYDNPPYSAFNQSLTESATWNLHIGAANVDYQGSLVFGGYDEGRAIGPVLEFEAVENGLIVGLRDIILGVEVGDSPVSSFSPQSGLLSPALQEGGAPLPAQIFPQFPYIGLPQATVNAIVNQLPVYHNSEINYWLWETTNPDYEKLVSSSAYMGFVLSSTTGSGPNVTVKVPFALLNLTLETSASGLDQDVPYLPILQTAVPDPVTPATLDLGRAFLQAAYIGANWATNSSWIAQAAGPGNEGAGIGVSLQNLPQSASTISLNSGDTLFQSSWSGHWKVYNSSSSGSSGSMASSSSSSSGISGGAIAGVVVGVVAVLAMIACIFWYRRRRSKSREVKEIPTAPTIDEKRVTSVSEMESPTGARRWSELETKEQRRELPTVHSIHELPGS